MAGLAEQWFRIADEDKDGKISGGEAVRFFMRSGLPKDVLGQIWDLASGGGPALTQLQFNTSMRLVALAQVSMGRLVPDQARAVAMGGGPQLPLPRMAGLEAGAAGPMAPPPGAPYTLQVTGAAPPGYAPQHTGGGPYAPQLTGGAGYAPQVTGSRPPAPGAAGGPGYGAPQATGGGYAPQVTGGFPPVSAEDMSRYRAQFGQLDRDGDGLVLGADCFGAFMQTGLDKRVLKHIWDLVAGTSGSLNGEQFVRAAYLMDLAKRGAPPPHALPPGPFPPLGPGAAMPPVPAPGGASAGPTGAAAGPTGGPPAAPQQWSLSSQFGEKTAAAAVSEVYDQTLPRLPGMPPKVSYDGGGGGRGAGPSEVPSLDEEVLKMLGGPDKERFEAAHGEASKKEADLRKAEAEAEAAKQRLKVFQEALAEVMLFRSRADVALMTAQDQAGRLAKEAEETERRYHVSYLAAEGQFAASEVARKELQGALAAKQEAANKLILLQQEIAMLNNMNPADMAALQARAGRGTRGRAERAAWSAAEVAGLVAQVSAAESKKAGLELQLDAGRKQRGLLGTRVQDLELSAAAGEAELGRVRSELAALLARADAVAAAPAAAGDGDAPLEVGDLCDMLVKSAGAYRSLLSAVQGRGADVPYAAALGDAGGLAWADAILAGSADWMDADAPLNEACGFAVVNALPELEGVPPALLRATGAAAQLLKPLKRGAGAAAGGGGGAAGEGAGGAPAAAPAPAEAGAEGADAPKEGAAATEAAGAGSPKKAAAAAGAAAAAVGGAAVGAIAAKVATAESDAAAAAAPEPEAGAAAPEAAAPAAAPAEAAAAPPPEAPAAAAAAAPEPAPEASSLPAAGAAAAGGADAGAASLAPAVPSSSAAGADAAALSFDEGDAFADHAGSGDFARQDSAAAGLANPFATGAFAPALAAGGYGGYDGAANVTGQSATTDSSGFEDNAF
ncbi:MAG: hypothetical protein J3K34DRAFT_521730 [Monoraphidium minutum]|nr:MAG: hypothetical protein J3K34DRAFT_521730 [Monoraphidium minutum]